MTLIDGCKHSVDISIPAERVAEEIERVVESLQSTVRIKGFRPGKAPVNLIRVRYKDAIRQEVLDSLIPWALEERIKADDLHIVSEPKVKDLKFEEGAPITFTAEFEVAPEIELGEYRNLTVHYTEAEVSDAEVDERLEQLRQQKAELVTVEPRPAAEGDFVIVELESVAGVEGEPIRSDELQVDLGAKDTIEAFSANLKGRAPGEETEFDVTYPEDFDNERLAGKTVRFHAKVKAIRKKELPELNDDFARDLGDFRDVGELRDAVRKSILREKEYVARRKAQDELLDQLVARHEFPVPEVFVNDQLRRNLERYARGLMAQGIDPRKANLDWKELAESHKEQAVKDVKASLLLGKIAERENIQVTQEELDREVERIARQRRQPVAAVRMEMEKDGSLRSLANQIRVEKTIEFLYDQARKVAG